MHALLYPGTLTHALTSRKEVYPGGSGTGTLRRTKQEHSTSYWSGTTSVDFIRFGVRPHPFE
jgi:hypothetical protein